MVSGPSAPTYDTSLDRTYLVIASNTLIPGNSYTFQLSAEWSGNTVTASVSFTINIGPESGSYTVTALSGNSTGTSQPNNYNLMASGWVDGDEQDYPIRYSFKYEDVTGSNIDLQEATTISEMQSELPYVANTAGLTRTLCYVYDALNTPAIRTVDVTVAQLT